MLATSPPWAFLEIMDLTGLPGSQPETPTEPPGQLASAPGILRATPRCLGCWSPVLFSAEQKAAAQEGVSDSQEANKSSH